MLQLLLESQTFIIQLLRWSLKHQQCKKTNVVMVQTLSSPSLVNCAHKLRAFSKWVFIHLIFLLDTRRPQEDYMNFLMNKYAILLRTYKITMKCLDAWDHQSVQSNMDLKICSVGWSLEPPWCQCQMSPRN